MIKTIVNEVFSKKEYQPLTNDFKDIFMDILFFQVSAHLFWYSNQIANILEWDVNYEIRNQPFIFNLLLGWGEKKDYDYYISLLLKNKILKKILQDDNLHPYYFSPRQITRNVLLDISKMNVDNPTLLLECYNECLKKILLNVYSYLKDNNNFTDYKSNSLLEEIISNTGIYNELFSCVCSEEEWNNKNEYYLKKKDIRTFTFPNKNKDLSFYKDFIILISLRSYQISTTKLDDNIIKEKINNINNYDNFLIEKAIVSISDYLKYQDIFHNQFISSLFWLFLKPQEWYTTKYNAYFDTMYFVYDMKPIKIKYKKIEFPSNIKYKMILKPLAKKVIDYMNMKENKNPRLLILEKDCPEDIKDFLMDYRTSSDDFYYALDNGYVNYELLTDTPLKDLTSEDFNLLSWYFDLIVF